MKGWSLARRLSQCSLGGCRLYRLRLQYSQPRPVAKQKAWHGSTKFSTWPKQKIWVSWFVAPMVWQMGMMRVEPRIFVWRATASQRAYDTNVYVISRHEHPWEEGWWCMVILCSIAWKVLKPQHFSFTQGLPAFLRRRCFMKSIPWEIPSWKLWSQSLPWPKSARLLGCWLDQVLVHLKFWMVSNCEQFCLVPKSWKLCPVKSCFCWKFHKFKWLDHPTSTISKTQLQLWNRKSPILLVSQDVNPCTWMSKD